MCFRIKKDVRVSLHSALNKEAICVSLLTLSCCFCNIHCNTGEREKGDCKDNVRHRLFAWQGEQESYDWSLLWAATSKARCSHSMERVCFMRSKDVPDTSI